MLGTIDVSLRPLKFAFVVRPSDRSAIHNAIMFNTYQWGGKYNPIIPAYKKLPKAWESYPNTVKPNPWEAVEHCLQRYDPDYIIASDEQLITELKKRHNNVLDSSNTFPPNSPNRHKYGVSIFEILNYVARKEFKFRRRDNLKIRINRKFQHYDLFFSAVFGKYTDDIHDSIIERYGNNVDIEENILNENSLHDRYTYIPPIALASYQIDIRTSSRREGYVLFLNPNSTLDILDYWNLRALGKHVYPISMHHTHALDMDDLKIFMSRFHYRYGWENSIIERIPIIKGRQTCQSEFSIFTETLSKQNLKGKDGSIYVIQQGFPPYWTSSNRQNDSTECCRIVVSEAEHRLASNSEKTSIKTLDPKIAHKHSTAKARFANVVSISTYGDNGEPLAQIIPDGGEKVARAVARMSSPGKWRTSRYGLVYLANHLNWSINLDIPNAETIMTAWFESKGWSVKLSSAGHIAKQALKQLGGIYGISTIAQREIIEILQHMAPSKDVSYDEIWGNIQMIANQDPYDPDPKLLLKGLLDHGILILGAKLQCPICQQRSWHSLRKLDYSVECPKCLNKHDIPSHSPTKIKWSYRSYGPFSIEDNAQGAYTVLLTLHFISNRSWEKTTPILSFTAVNGKDSIEADLALFLETSHFGEHENVLIFAECKSQNKIETKDIDRMKLIRSKFPHSYIIFAKISENLSQDEKELLRRLVEEMSQGKSQYYTPRVAILTSTELFSRFLELRERYEEKSDKHREVAEKYEDLQSMENLCRATQYLYL